MLTTDPTVSLIHRNDDTFWAKLEGRFHEAAGVIVFTFEFDVSLSFKNIRIFDSTVINDKRYTEMLPSEKRNVDQFLRIYLQKNITADKLKAAVMESYLRESARIGDEINLLAEELKLLQGTISNMIDRLNRKGKIE